jgi:hypothetical protein
MCKKVSMSLKTLKVTGVGGLRGKYFDLLNVKDQKLENQNFPHFYLKSVFPKFPLDVF